MTRLKEAANGWKARPGEKAHWYQDGSSACNRLHGMRGEANDNQVERCGTCEGVLRRRALRISDKQRIVELEAEVKRLRDDTK